MCKFYYSYTACGCDTITWLGDAEYCGSRCVDGYNGVYLFDEMCPNIVIVCYGVENVLCEECSEYEILEFELHEDELI